MDMYIQQERMREMDMYIQQEWMREIKRQGELKLDTEEEGERRRERRREGDS